MKLYLVRHGESALTGSDNERPLSEKGKKDIQRLVEFISSLKIEVSFAFQSPKLRAQQTASMLLTAIHSKNKIEIHNELDPMAVVDHMIEELYVSQQDTLLVGHMPFMGKLVAKLITGDEYKDIVLFQPGCMLCLEYMGNGQWVICWMLSPGQI
jgi:phosphohistidine phosphatase